MLKKLFFLVPVVLLSACSLSPGIYLEESHFDSVDEESTKAPPVRLIPISPSLIQQHYQRIRSSAVASAPKEQDVTYHYLVGPQDVLSITVWEHPELTIPAGGQRPVEQEGNQVRSDGTIFYPYVGVMHVAGKTAEQIRAELTSRLSRYIKNPQLDVRVVGFNSQKVHVAGAVASPGVIPITDVPQTLSDVITLSGGPTERADIQEVILTRDGINHRYNLQALYHEGDMSQNVLLKDGDIVFVPVNSYRKVYVMGEVGNSKALPMPDGRLNLAEVIASASIDQKAADPERIYVLRQGEVGAEAYLLDASQPGALILATTFPMQPLDVVFVSTSDLTRWNRVLSQLLPTVQTLWTLDRITDGL